MGTLAYNLPDINKLKDEEVENKNSKSYVQDRLPLMLWQLPVLPTGYKGLNVPFELGYIMVSEDGSMQIKIDDQTYSLHLAAPLKVTHQISFISPAQNLYNMLGQLEQRLVILPDFESQEERRLGKTVHTEKLLSDYEEHPSK